MWYHEKIGGGRCPIVDTWWQTETGGIMISPLPGATALKPGSCTKPLPGIFPEVVGDDGKPVPAGRRRLAGDRPALAGHDARHLGRRPAVPRPILEKRARQVSRGDNARCDSDGYYWIMGRIDDVLNVSGHRLSTIEVESALVSHPAVVEAAAVGRPHELKGEAMAVFITLGSKFEASEELRQELKDHVRKEIGSLAVPDDIHFASALPKTRSGKIMRRLLRDIAAGRADGGRHQHARGFQCVGAAARRGGVRPCSRGGGMSRGREPLSLPTSFAILHRAERISRLQFRKG